MEHTVLSYVAANVILYQNLKSAREDSKGLGRATGKFCIVVVVLVGYTMV